MQSREEVMTDICSVCGKCQEYRTMSDITEESFDLICDDCLDKATKPNEELLYEHGAIGHTEIGHDPLP